MTNKPNNQSAQEVDEKLMETIRLDENTRLTNSASPWECWNDGFRKGYNKAIQSTGRYSLELLMLVFNYGKKYEKTQDLKYSMENAIKDFQSLTPHPYTDKGREVKTCPNCKSIKVGMVYEFHKCYDCEEMW